jgi:hypothetical protein
VDDRNAAILAGVGVREHRDGTSDNRANGSFTSTPAVRGAKTPCWCRFGLTHYLVRARRKPAASHRRLSIRFSKPESHSVRRRDADYRNAHELALLRSAAMYFRNFLDGFDQLVAFDAETTGKRTPDAEFIRKQPFAWRAPGIIIEVGFVEMLRDGEGCARARRGAL